MTHDPTPARPSKPLCGARRPGWQYGPAIGRHRIPCTLPEGHDSDHRDGLGQTWPVAPAEQLGATTSELTADSTVSVLLADLYALADGLNQHAVQLRVLARQVAELRAEGGQ